MDRKVFIATLVLLAVMTAFYVILYMKTMPMLNKAEAMVNDITGRFNFNKANEKK